MNTPIYDFLMRYAEGEVLRCHMPGHKGRAGNDVFEMLFQMDITEITGADSLFEADGIIAESERNMSQLYQTAGTAYSAGGSTLCIQTMLALMKQEKRKVFAVRNVHRAFLNAAALLDLDVEWIMPQYTAGILSGELDLGYVEEALAKCSEPSCLYITSPDYTGKIADIAAVSAVCKKYGAKLLVDNAHGAHLAFFEGNHHPIALGADLCCDSAHKMLPALTGSACLHTYSAEYAEKLKQTMSLFASTSPSYIIMAALDLCNKYIDTEIRQDISENIMFIKNFREHFHDRLNFVDGDPFHITIKAAESGYNGNELAQQLRKNDVECEYSDSEILILLMSPMNRADDYKKLSDALDNAVVNSKKSAPEYGHVQFPQPEQAMSIREAVFAQSEEIDVENSVGRICASVKVPCPPAVPIAASGEIITSECINIFKRYGISRINVVK